MCLTVPDACLGPVGTLDEHHLDRGVELALRPLLYHRLHSGLIMTLFLPWNAARRRSSPLISAPWRRTVGSLPTDEICAQEDFHAGWASGSRIV